MCYISIDVFIINVTMRLEFQLVLHSFLFILVGDVGLLVFYYYLIIGTVNVVKW